MTTVNVEYGGNVVQVQVGENTLAAAASAAAAASSATLSGLYANADTDADIPGAAPGERGAKYWADLVGGAVGAVKQRVTLVLQPDDGIVEAAWYGEFFVPVNTDYTFLRHWIYMGTGTCDIYVHVDDINVAGPVAVGTTSDSDAVTISATAGQRVSFQIENITGAPEGIAIAMEGLPA